MAGTDPKAQRLVEEGLALYSAGRLEEALGKWDQALSIDPAVPRAAEYRQYVAENRAALASSFSAASSATHPVVSPSQPAEEPADELSLEIDVSDEDFVVGTPDSAASEDVGLDFTPAVDLSLPPLGDLAMEGEDLTPQVTLRSLDGGLAMQSSDRTNRIELDEYRPEIERSGIQARRQQATPLTVLPGRGAPRPSGDDFEPAELTPVGIKLPQPSRLVAEGELGLTPPTEADLGEVDLGEVDEELMRGQATPAKFGRDDRLDNDFGRHDNDFGIPAAVGVGELGVTSPAAAGAADLELPAGGGDDLLAGLGEMLQGTAPDRKPNDFELLDSTAEGGPRAAAALEELAAGGSVADGDQVDQDVDTMLAGAHQLFEQGTHEGSLWLCERILNAEPDHGAASALLARNEDALLEQYQQKLGDLDVVPVVRVPQHEIVWHKLDHRAGFLLSRVDGMLTFNDILDVSGMGRFETCRILSQLIDQGVIAPRK